MTEPLTPEEERQLRTAVKTGLVLNHHLSVTVVLRLLATLDAERTRPVPPDGLQSLVDDITAIPWNVWDSDEPSPDEQAWGVGVEWYVGEYRSAVLAALDAVVESTK